MKPQGPKCAAPACGVRGAGLSNFTNLTTGDTIHLCFTHALMVEKHAESEDAKPKGKRFETWYAAARDLVRPAVLP